MSAVRCRPGPRSEVQRRRAERLFADHAFQLAQMAIERALAGDPVALVACLDRAWPVERQRPEPAAREGTQ